MEPLIIILLAFAAGFFGFKYFEIKTLHTEALNTKSVLSSELDSVKLQLNEKISLLSLKEKSFEEQNKELVQAKLDHLELKTKMEAQNNASEEKLIYQQRQTQKYLDDLKLFKSTMETEFKQIAGKLLEERSKDFSESNKSQITNLIDPLKAQIKEFRERIDVVHKGDSDDRSSLKAQIEELRKLNVTITHEATALTKALKGQSQARGAWGELVLERLLESAGLRKGETFLVQEQIINADGRRLRPDILIRLPDNKYLVIDSKVSLIAYEQAINATNDADKQKAISEHVKSVKRHVEDLSSKSYDDTGKIVTPDYVFMFIPLDSAFSMAIEAESNLYEWAFEKRVILITAPSLLVTLKTVAIVWNQEMQNRHVQDIAERGGKLYDKFVGLYKDLENMGDQIKNLQNSYEASVSKIKSGNGNLVSQVEKLKSLGAKAKKSLPESAFEAATES